MLEQGFSAAASWLKDDFLRKGLIEGNQRRGTESDFLWMERLDFNEFGKIGARLLWACLGLFCGVPMVLLQYLYAAVMQVVYNGYKSSQLPGQRSWKFQTKWVTIDSNFINSNYITVVILGFDAVDSPTAKGYRPIVQFSLRLRIRGVGKKCMIPGIKSHHELYFN